VGVESLESKRATVAASTAEVLCSPQVLQIGSSHRLTDMLGTRRANRCSHFTRCSSSQWQSSWVCGSVVTRSFISTLHPLPCALRPPARLSL
jgi:hypothetical protein